MRFKLLCACLCSLLAFFGAMPPTYAGVVTLKLGHTESPATPLAYGVAKLAELAGRYSNGTLIIKVFHSGQLGAQPELVESLRYGTLDMTTASTDFMMRYIPEMGVFGLPFIFRNADHAYKSLDTIGMEVAAAGEALGLKTLAILERDQMHLSNSMAVLREPRDLRGRTMRERETAPYSREMFFYMGARTMAVTREEARSAIERGRMDGQESGLGDLWKQRLCEVQKYISLTGHVYVAEPVLISVASWKKLDPTQQLALIRAASDAAQWQRELCRKLYGDYLNKIHREGKSHITYKVERKAFENAMVPVWRLFCSHNEMGAMLVERIRMLE